MGIQNRWVRRVFRNKSNVVSASGFLGIGEGRRLRQGKGASVYGKFFASAFIGSMRGAGADVFAVWSYVISHTVNSRVEVNPEDAAPRIGMSVERVIAALDYLEKPDAQSRSGEYEGRRMVKEGQFAYFIPNHRTYRDIKTAEDLMAYNARKQRESRARLRQKEIGEIDPSKLTEAQRKIWKAAKEKGKKDAEKRVRRSGEVEGRTEVIGGAIQSAHDDLARENEDAERLGREEQA